MIGGVYGNAHTISTPSLASNVTDSDCQQTTFNWTEKFYCKAISNATNYEWKFVNNSSGNTYVVQRGNSNTNMTFKWASINLCSTSCLPNSIGSAYSVSVRPIFSPPNSQGFGSSCTLIQGSSSKLGTYAINENRQFGELSIYPNPNDGKEFYLNASGFKNTKDNIVISVTDIYGKTVYHRVINNNATQIITTINLANPLSAGVYLVKVAIGENVIIKYMVVQ